MIAVDDAYGGRFESRRELHSRDLAALAKDVQILLATDGTVTHILEIVAREPVIADKLFQRRETPSAEVVAALDLGSREEVVRRDVKLLGRTSGRVFVRAESWLATARLPAIVAHALETTTEPLGVIMAGARMQTFREIISVWAEQGAGAPLDNRLWFPARTYSVWAAGRPAMLITERFVGFPSYGDIGS